MAFGCDGSPPRQYEKWSKKNNDPTGSSKPSGRTKEACPHVATGARGHGRGTRACGAQPSSQAPTVPPPRVGATQWEWVPGIGCIPVADPTKEALDQEGHTIDLEVCPLSLLLMASFSLERAILSPSKAFVPPSGSLSAHPMMSVVTCCIYQLTIVTMCSGSKNSVPTIFMRKKARICGLSIGFGIPFISIFMITWSITVFSAARWGNL